jgi:NAD(P)H dehydrogenase (quinone)
VTRKEATVTTNRAQAAPPANNIGIAGAERPLCADISRLLGHQGIEHTVLAHDPSQIPRGLPRAHLASMDLTGRLPEFTSLATLRTLLLAPAAPTADAFAQEHEFVDAAAAAGVHHIVYISILGAAVDARFQGARDHYHLEQRIKETGVRFTILQPTLLLERAADLLAPTGDMFGPGGHGHVSLTTRHVVATVAARILTNPEPHSGHTYPITGTETITMKQVAAHLTGHSGHSIHYRKQTADDTYTRLVDHTVPSWRAAATISLYEAVAGNAFAVLAPPPEVKDTPPSPPA